MTEFFISDTHFGSFNVAFRQNNQRLIKSGLVRPDEHLTLDQSPENWSKIDQLDELMVNRWNAKVQNNDVVYFLGDLAILRNYQQWTDCLVRLNGHKVFVVGNHDQSRALKYALKEPKTKIIEVVTTAKLIKRNKQQLWISHYPTLVSTKMINVHGHIHARPIETMLVTPENGGDIEQHRFFNVGVDSDDMAFLKFGEPISLDELLLHLPQIDFQRYAK